MYFVMESRWNIVYKYVLTSLFAILRLFWKQNSTEYSNNLFKFNDGWRKFQEVKAYEFLNRTGKQTAVKHTIFIILDNIEKRPCLKRIMKIRAFVYKLYVEKTYIKSIKKCITLFVKSLLKINLSILSATFSLDWQIRMLYHVINKCVGIYLWLPAAR